MKYDSNGKVLWARRIGGEGGEIPISLVTDNRHIYLTGRFDVSLNFYNKSGDIEVSLNKKGRINDTYIAKYLSNGTLSWARQIAGTNDVTNLSKIRYDMVVTDNVNVYIIGYFDNSLFFYNETGVIDVSFNKISPQTKIDTFIAKYEPNGKVSSVRIIKGTANFGFPMACVTQHPMSNICFIKGTPIVTDQGIIEIQDITNENTINNVRVKYITQTTTNEYSLVCIEKDAICENIPSQTTILSENHKLLYNGQMVKAKNVTTSRIPYNGEILYNVLLEENGLMMVNNLICETLDINNVVALLYEHPNKNEIIKTLNGIKDNDVYKKTANELLC